MRASVHHNFDRSNAAKFAAVAVRESPPERIKHLPVRDRDALMFRRGLVHTFSTVEDPLVLLSYHRLNDRATRGIVPDPVRAPLVRKAFELYATGDYTIVPRKR